MDIRILKPLTGHRTYLGRQVDDIVADDHVIFVQMGLDHHRMHYDFEFA